MFLSSMRFLMLAAFVALSFTPALSQVTLMKGDHECTSNNPQEKALLDAVKHGDLALLRRILKQGANPDAKDDCGVSAVTFAVDIVRPDLLKELITAGADVNPIDDFYRKPPLFWAIDSVPGEKEGDIIEIVKLLIDAGANVNLKRKIAEPALILAVNKEMEKVTGLLIAGGADINAKDRDGRTAYSYSAQIGNLKLKSLLLSAGADPTIGVKEYREEYGEDAFIQAAANGRTDIVEALLASGTDVNTANQGRATALLIASEDSTVDALLAAGADVNKKGAAGITALIRAAMFGRAEQVRKLIAAGADVNAITNDGKTALDLAKPEVKKILVQAGARKGRTGTRH